MGIFLVDWLLCEEKNFLILRESTNGECLKIRILVYGLFRIFSPSVFARVFDTMKVYMHLHLFSFIPANVGLLKSHLLKVFENFSLLKVWRLLEK